MLKYYYKKKLEVFWVFLLSDINMVVDIIFGSNTNLMLFQALS